MLGSDDTAADNAGTSLLYAGEQYDSALGQYYLRARYYNPYNGSFNRMDPYAGSPSDPQSLHKYLYCHANPINGIDPSGNFNIGIAVLVVVVAIFLYLSISRTLEERRATRPVQPPQGLAGLDFEELEFFELVEGMQAGTSNVPDAWEHILEETGQTARNQVQWRQACDAVGAYTLGTNVEGVVAEDLTAGQWRIVAYFESEWYNKYPELKHLQTYPGSDQFPKLRGSVEIIAMSLRIRECIQEAEDRKFDASRITRLKAWSPPQPPFYSEMYPGLW